MSLNITKEMAGVWWAQIKAVVRLEMRKTFFARRGLWIYVLALLPLLLFTAHAVIISHERQQSRQIASQSERPLTYQDLLAVKPGMKSQEVNFGAVKQGVAMEAVLRHYQVNDLQGGRSGRYRGRCPIHQGEGCDAFHVDVRRKIFHCFSCGAGGDVLDLVALLNQCTLREAALQLQDWLTLQGS